MLDENMYKIILLNEGRVSKNVAKNLLGYNSTTLIRHLFYVFLEYRKMSVNSWTEEIYYYYENLPELQSKRKKLTKKEIYESITNKKLNIKDFHKIFNRNIEIVNYKFKDTYNTHNSELEKSLFAFVNDYIIWLSTKLYDYTYNDIPFSIKDVENKLSDLYKIYHKEGD